MSKFLINSINILICAAALTCALTPQKVEFADAKTKIILDKYINNISDIEDLYVINQKLSKAIARYFKHKVDLFPLYKINLKIDRNPVKIPWTLGKSETDPSIKKREYHIESSKLNST